MSVIGAGQTHTSAVKGRCRFLHWLSRNECNYASFKACPMSAIRSDGCSMPIDSRGVENAYFLADFSRNAGVGHACRQAGKRLGAAQAHRQLEDLQRVQEFERRGLAADNVERK